MTENRQLRFMKFAFASLFGGEETYEDVLDKSGITEKPVEEDIIYPSRY